jgi:hypothetical protein
MYRIISSITSSIFQHPAENGSSKILKFLFVGGMSICTSSEPKSTS